MNGSSPLAFIVAKKKIQRMYWSISYNLVLLLRARKPSSPGSECSSVSAPGHFQFAALPVKAPCTSQPKGNTSDKSQSFCTVNTSLTYLRFMLINAVFPTSRFYINVLGYIWAGWILIAGWITKSRTQIVTGD